jgi:hypothetical protein
MMIPIHKFAGQDLLWTPSAALKHQYELLAGETVLATLDMSSWISAAQAVTADGSFIIKREGFFRQQVMIRASESEPILATYTRGWGGGTLQFTNGHLFKWENANFWGTKKAWKAAPDTCLVHFQNSPWTRDLLTRIEMEAVSLPEHPLLVILGFYITLLSKREGSANQAHINII